MTENQIRVLLESRLSTWAASRLPALKIAFENSTFAPPDGPYLRAYVLSANTDSRDLLGMHRGRIGIFQVDVVGVTGVGVGAVESIVADLDTLFPNNLRLPGGATHSLQIISPVSKSPGLQDPDRHVVTVSTTYREDSI